MHNEKEPPSSGSSLVPHCPEGYRRLGEAIENVKSVNGVRKGGVAA
jgi:hypothetical protein